MSSFLIFDSSVVVHYLRSGRHRELVHSVAGLIRNSSVVLAELWRGATREDEREFIRDLGQNHPILVPTQQNWLDSGKLLARIAEDQGFTASKLRDMHFDVLIALTARSHGARLITANRADFELIKRYSDFQLEVW
jgi:predicted nucleic acid-binding protein